MLTSPRVLSYRCVLVRFLTMPVGFKLHKFQSHLKFSENSLGLRSTFITFFTLYLSNWCITMLLVSTERQQRVVVKREASDWLAVTSSDPQGSLLDHHSS